MSDDSARRWLQLAREDVRAAEAGRAAGTHLPRHACYWAQQGVEKALKAVLAFNDLRVPRTHDLDGLRERIPAGWRLKAEHPPLGTLSRWAEQGRYPLDVEDAEEADAEEAIEIAHSVLDAVARDLRAHGLQVDG